MFLIRGALNAAVMSAARNSPGIVIPALPARHAIPKTSDLRNLRFCLKRVIFQWQFFYAK
jgi:Fe-S-cluster containining protein